MARRGIFGPGDAHEHSQVRQIVQQQGTQFHKQPACKFKAGEDHSETKFQTPAGQKRVWFEAALQELLCSFLEGGLQVMRIWFLVNFYHKKGKRAF